MSALLSHLAHLAHPCRPPTALARVQPFDAIQKLTAALEALKPAAPLVSIADLSAKLMLTLNEAARLRVCLGGSCGKLSGERRSRPKSSQEGGN